MAYHTNHKKCGAPISEPHYITHCNQNICLTVHLSRVRFKGRINMTFYRNIRTSNLSTTIIATVIFFLSPFFLPAL